MARRQLEEKRKSRLKTPQRTEAQFARVKTALAARTPNPSIGLGSLQNMGGSDGEIAKRYARASRGYMKRKPGSHLKRLLQNQQKGAHNWGCPQDNNRLKREQLDYGIIKIHKR